MAAKLTTMTHKISIQLHLVAESCTIRSSRCRWNILSSKMARLQESLITPAVGEQIQVKSLPYKLSK
jgi:hypothetical protein